MSYAVNKAAKSWRAVESKKDLLDGEVFSATQPVFDYSDEADAERLSAKLRAYADPITGSDRFFSEAMRMDAMGESGADEVRAAGVSRYLEIKDSFIAEDAK